jgi:hypothetical protein
MFYQMGNSSTALAGATGRPGRGGEVTVLPPQAHSPVGYEPHRLDETISRHIGACEKSIRIAESLGKKVEEAVKHVADVVLVGGAASLEDADKLSALFERMTKATLNVVKATDEMSRLRSFVAGGPDSRPDYTAKSEIELREMLFEHVRALGFDIVPRKV